MTTHAQLVGGEVGGVSPWDLCRKLALLPEGAARRAVWGTLDAWLSERGKSAAAKAWCEARRGEARLVCLRGFGDGRSVFRAVAKALGLAVNYSVLPRALRDRVTDCMAESGLGLVIDEAHYLLPEPGRRGRPEMVDWLNAGLREAGVPVALVTTPQFAPRLADLQRREGWNVGQFRRRFAGHWLTLDAATSDKDLAELAGRLLPMVGDRGLKLCVDYARGWRDVSGLADLVTAARKRAEAGGRAQPILEDLLSALRGDRLPTEKAMEAAFARSMSGKPARQPATVATPQTGRGASAMAVQSVRRVSPLETLPVSQ